MIIMIITKKGKSNIVWAKAQNGLHHSTYKKPHAISILVLILSYTVVVARSVLVQATVARCARTCCRQPMARLRCPSLSLTPHSLSPVLPLCLRNSGVHIATYMLWFGGAPTLRWH